MLAVLSAIAAVGCILVSARRLRWAVAPTSLDPRLLCDALRTSPDSLRQSMVEALVARADLGWEHDLGVAITENAGEAREALVAEQTLELDWALQRWATVPRVCASIATSAGFMFASVALLQGLSVPADPESGAVWATLMTALDALAVGIAGTAFCVAVHLRVRRRVAGRLAAAQKLADQLSSLPEGPRP
jgi:hypothetical protein